MRWEKVEVGEGPGKRWGHTCNAVKGGRFLYLFGGYGKYNRQTNQVHVFDTVKQTWSQPAIKGCPPTPRDSHSCTTVGDYLFVFGGTDGTNLLKDLHILDTSSHTWISPSVKGEGPEAREGHSAALVGKSLFVFGGCGKSADNNNEVNCNDLYILNTETFVWKRATTSGTAPAPRDSHTCSSWKNIIIVIGGEDEHDYYLNDVHILDTDTLIWRELRTSGQLLPPRAGHSTVSFGKYLFVFGGFSNAQSLYNDLYMLDIDTGLWTKVITTPNGPSARFSVAGDCLDPCKGGVLVFIGGCNRSLEALDDMYYLYTGILWEGRHGPEKLSLRKQLKLKCQEQNLNPVQPMTVSGYRKPTSFLIFYRGTAFSWLLSKDDLGHLCRPDSSQTFCGKKIFLAEVTESSSDGYFIETDIEGKRLHGFVFLNKPNTLNPATNISSRKRTADETGSVISNGMHLNNLTTSKVHKQNETEDRQGVLGDGSESHEHLEGAVTAVIPSNPITASSSNIFKVSANHEPEPVSLNRNDDEENDRWKSLGEKLKNDGANDMRSSEGEVQTDEQTNVTISNSEAPRLARHDQKSDAPNCNPDIPKPAAAENAMCLSKQGVTGNCATPRAEGHSEPEKLT